MLFWRKDLFVPAAATAAGFKKTLCPDALPLAVGRGRRIYHLWDDHPNIPIYPFTNIQGYWDDHAQDGAPQL